MKILKLLRNFYVIVLLVVLVWIFLIDVNDVPTQLGNAMDISALKAEKEYYAGQIEALTKEQDETLGSAKALEKYAREQYYMKKDSEDVFVLIDEKGEPTEK